MCGKQILNCVGVTGRKVNFLGINNKWEFENNEQVVTSNCKRKIRLGGTWRIIGD